MPREEHCWLLAFLIWSGTLQTSGYWHSTNIRRPFPDSSVGKESAYNAGDPGSIPGSGRSAGEEIGYPLQYSWASLVAQLLKNPPAMQETWVPQIQSLGREDPLEESLATQSSILAWRIPWREEPGELQSSGLAKSRTRLKRLSSSSSFQRQADLIQCCVLRKPQ